MEVIVTNGTLTTDEQQRYIDYTVQKYPQLIIEKLFLEVDGDFVNIRIQPQKRVLTKMGGAVIGDPLTWNDAKRAEYWDTIPNPIV